MSPLNFALKLARKSGKIIKASFFDVIEKEYHSTGSPVTKVDRKINKLVINEIRENFPEQDLIGEEESHKGTGSEFSWVCDPLDGTKAFISKVPTCVFSIAQLKNGVPILGVIYDPFMDRMYYAEKGKGAYLNGDKIFVSKDKDVNKKMMAIDYSLNTIVDMDHIYTTLRKDGVRIFQLGATLYQCMLVASGEFFGTVYPFINQYDVAAAKVIIEEAGGKVTDLYGNEQRYDRSINGAILSNGFLHNYLIKAVNKNVKRLRK